MDRSPARTSPAGHPANQRGMVAVTVALLLLALLSFAALALDISSLFVVRNELQNAADAGALAAARVLYTADGTAINSGANAVGVTAATANAAQGVAVELTGNPAGNTGDVQRGHWKWSDRSFTPNNSLAAVTLSGVSTADLDVDPDFINAVRVRARRQSVPARSFLSRILGFADLPMQAEAIAYIGFAGTLLAGEGDAPVAVCEEELLNGDGDYSCSTGRMMNSSGNASYNTGGWTNFTQDPCSTASASSIQPYVDPACSAASAPELTLGIGMGTTGGQVQSVWDDFYDCWESSSDSNADGKADTVFNLTLPVVSCPGKNVGNCSTLVGAVNVNLLWMVRNAQSDYDWAPYEMSGPGISSWVCPDSITGGAAFADLSADQKEACWHDFIAHYGLVNYEGASISTMKRSDWSKTMYFFPDCTRHEPTGGTGGPNFGILAKIPVLVD